MEEQKQVQVGGPVVFIDRVGKPRAALVTAVWGRHSVEGRVKPDEELSLNVVIIAEDATKGDPYGRQIERETSIPHESRQAAHGYAWRHAA